ncbi:MAG: 2-oxoacid:acceptor oxidoreductase family protein [Candidatus Aenigmarchaeota archaeon]|nr:2-oxoacid:acceptor oxidoreductase family protein [Candidatus Aenigmarchaeota archaeon]
MYEISFYARAGQGAKSAAQFLAESAIKEGKFVQAFPNYGPARQGAPMQAFVRISRRPIKIHSAVVSPQVVVVIDPSLLDFIDVAKGLDKQGFVLVNTSLTVEQIRKKISFVGKIYTFDASSIALELLKKNFANVVLLGQLVKLSKIVKLENLLLVAKKKFSHKLLDQQLITANLTAIKSGYQAIINSGRGISNSQRNKKITFKTDKLKNWREVLPGGLITQAGNATKYQTGNWRDQRPIVDHNKCIKCMACVNLCPEHAIHLVNGKIVIDYKHCKGCGICATTCPVKAIKMIKENKK